MRELEKKKEILRRTLMLKEELKTEEVAFLFGICGLAYARRLCRVLAAGGEFIFDGEKLRRRGD